MEDNFGKVNAKVVEYKFKAKEQSEILHKTQIKSDTDGSHEILMKLMEEEK